MLTVLQRYVFREILGPALVALGTLTFVMLIRAVFLRSDDLDGILTLPVMAWLMTYMLPSLLTLIVPMSILVGVMLGIGRMTVDSEIKACRTHGVNLFTVFLPILLFGAGLTFLVLFNSLYFAPRMLQNLATLTDHLRMKVMESLPSGHFFSDFPKADGNQMVLYFSDKEPETGLLMQVKVWVEGAPPELKDDTFSSQQSDMDILKRIGLSVQDTGMKTDGEGLSVTNPNRSLAPNPDDFSSPAVESQFEVDALSTQGVERTEEPESEIRFRAPSAVKTLFLASTGRIVVEPDPVHPRAMLVLSNGSVHVLGGGSDERYTVVDFKQMSNRIDLATDKIEVKKQAPLMTGGLLRQEISREMTEHRQRIDAGESDDGVTRHLKNARLLKSEYYQRLSISLACFVFVLVGLPLAIYIRPSGKSIGITIAFVLILIYYMGWHYGGEMTREGFQLGPVVVFLPNVLLTIVGAVMFHRTVHR